MDSAETPRWALKSERRVNYSELGRIARNNDATATLFMKET